MVTGKTDLDVPAGVHHRAGKGAMPEMSRRALVASGPGALTTLTGLTHQDERAGPASRTQTPTSSGLATGAQPSTGAEPLLVYFSRPDENYVEGGRRNLDVGDTKRLAQMILDRLGCDSYEILAADAHPMAYPRPSNGTGESRTPTPGPRSPARYRT